MVDANNVQYQLLLNNLPHAFSYQKLITDGEGKAVDCIFLEVNDAFEKLTGLARDRVIGKRLTEITLGAKKLDHNWLKTCSKAALTGQSISFEQNCESDNSWQEVTAYSDKTGYFAAIFRDITAGREKERVLREIGAKEQVILNAFPDMVFLCDNEGFFLDYYTTDRNLLAEEPEKFLGKSVWEVLPKKMAEKYMHCSQIAQKTQQPQVIEYDLEVLGGVRFFEARITPLDEKRLLAIVRNITERKETERALRESEEKYRSLVENLNEIVYVLNEKAEIVYVSPNIEAIGGYTVSEVQGRSFTDFVHEEDKNGRMEQFYKIFFGINEATEYRFVTKDGDTIWMRTAARPIVEEGQVVGIQGVLTDITDRKERDKRLRDQRAKIEALHHVSLKMENCDDEEEICNLTVEAAEEILNFTYGKVGLVEGDWIRVKATSPGFEQEDIPANLGLAGRTLRKGKSIVVDDVQEDEDAQPFRRNYRGAVSIPIGNLGVFQAVSHKKKAFNAEDVEMAELLVAHTLAAIKRIRRDKELAESQKRLNTLLTQTPAVIYSCQIVNGETLITYISENIKNVLGFEPQDFIGNFDFWQKQVHPDDAKGLASKNPMTFKEDRVTREEYRFRDREGNYRWLHDEHRFIVGEEGNMEVVGAWWDITDRKEMEETLIESENKYRMLVSNVPGAVFRCKNDPEWTMEYINEEIEEITGYPASDFI